MAPALWTAHEKEVIDYYFQFWKLSDKPGHRKNIVSSASWKCGDWKLDYDTCLDNERR